MGTKKIFYQETVSIRGDKPFTQWVEDALEKVPHELVHRVYLEFHTQETYEGYHEVDFKLGYEDFTHPVASIKEALRNHPVLKDSSSFEKGRRLYLTLGALPPWYNPLRPLLNIAYTLGYELKKDSTEIPYSSEHEIRIDEDLGIYFTPFKYRNRRDNK